MCLLDFKRIRCHCSKIIINDLIRNQLNEIWSHGSLRVSI
jgi:hypothetical protein